MTKPNYSGLIAAACSQLIMLGVAGAPGNTLYSILDTLSHSLSSYLVSIKLGLKSAS